MPSAAGPLKRRETRMMNIVVNNLAAYINGKSINVVNK